MKKEGQPKCARCRKSPCNTYTVEGGEVYSFCRACADLFELIPDVSLLTFESAKQESKVSKNMREAWIKRAQGESLWL